MRTPDAGAQGFSATAESTEEREARLGNLPIRRVQAELTQLRGGNSGQDRSVRQPINQIAHGVVEFGAC
jgi:hypothetical protein